MRLLSMAALAVMGAVMTGCSSDDNIIEQPQQPEVIKNNVVTLTTTVGFDDAAGTTRALSSTGVKTFAAGETMALVYKNTGGSTVKVVSAALTDGNITDGGKSATFTFELTDPDKAQDVTYIYPAAMAKDDGSVNYDALNSQDGTLSTLSSNLDLATSSAAWDGNNLPAVTLANQLAILAVTLKNEAGTSDITSGTTKLTVSDGTNTYNVTPSAAEGPIYVAIRPTTSATINIEAINGGNGYCKTLTTKTYAANNGYSVSWKMMPATLLSTISSNYTAQNGETLYGKLGRNVKISIANGATVTLKDVTINGVYNDSYKWAGITCAGNATITLEGTNTVKGFAFGYPGIYVPENKTLTIEGEGSLNATSNADASGIGGGWHMHCGNIVINGGNITATGGDYNAGIGGGEGDIYYDDEEGEVEGYARYRCGSITINGGTVTATGGYSAAGIGGGYVNGTCGTITIKSTVTKVTATKGYTAPNSIGAGDQGEYITVNIEAGADVTQN